MRTYCAARIRRSGLSSLLPEVFVTTDASSSLPGDALNSPKTYLEEGRMSFTKKDRKIQSESGKTFPAITPESLAHVIAAALRAEFGATPSSVKTVARLIDPALDADIGPPGPSLAIQPERHVMARQAVEPGTHGTPTSGLAGSVLVSSCSSTPTGRKPGCRTAFRDTSSAARSSTPMRP